MTRDFVDSIVARSHAPVVAKPTGTAKSDRTAGSDFQDVLKNTQVQATRLKVSAHAETRMKQRGLQLTGEDLQRLGSAVDQAQAKGSREAYLMYGQAGFIVNIPNRTVVTAMDMKEQTLVTNIDSVLFVDRPDL